MSLIKSPTKVIEHIITKEVQADVPPIPNDTPDDTDIDLAFTVYDKQINSKKLIEEISSNSRLIPYFKNNKLRIQRINPSVNPELTSNDPPGEVSLYINQSDVISYSNQRTAPEKIYTEVIVNYHYDYILNEFTKNTKDNSDNPDNVAEHFDDSVNQHEPGKTYDIAQLGLTKEQELLFDANYIRDDSSAEALQQFLML